MSLDTNFLRIFQLATICLASCLLTVACGGGGGGGSPSGAPGLSILDSFGRNVVAEGGGYGDGDAGADGTAGDGAPIAGGTVLITDANGKTGTAVTDSAGYYRVKVTGFVPPFTAKITKPDGKVRYSLNINPIKTNGFITMNISGLTEKIASDVAVAAGQNGASKLTPKLLASNSGVVTQSINNLKTQLSAVINAGGVTSSNFDPLSVPFKADHTGYDFVLDNTVITTDANGLTQVAISPNFVAPMVGTWANSATSVSGGQTGAVQDIGTFPGASVPTSAATINSGVTNVFTFIFPKTPPAGTTITYPSNNSVRVVSATADGTLTMLNFNASNYSGCGACGVGSSVSFDISMTFTLVGTLNGVTQPTETHSIQITSTWKRVS